MARVVTTRAILPSSRRTVRNMANKVNTTNRTIGKAMDNRTMAIRASTDSRVTSNLTTRINMANSTTNTTTKDNTINTSKANIKAKKHLGVTVHHHPATRPTHTVTREILQTQVIRKRVSVASWAL